MPQFITALEPSNDTGFVPLVEREVATKHNAFVASDDRYRAAVRLLASLWREEEGLPIGEHVDRDGTVLPLGSRISEKAGRAGRNFMTPAVADLASRELTFCQVGALYDASRFRTNLLASQSLCLNLFGLAKLDPLFADRMMSALFPNTFKQVTGVSFEFSPGRADRRFTADYTAIDVLVFGISPEDEATFVGIEVKYAESGNRPSRKPINPRHFQIASDSGFIAKPETVANLGGIPQQLLREMALMQSMIQNGAFERGKFVVVSPAANRNVAEACTTFQEHLAPQREGVVGFDVVALEQVIDAIAGAGHEFYAQRLEARYCDFTRIEKLLNASVS